jgi:lipopolysaccharide transport system ATP-binding protein
MTNTTVLVEGLTKTYVLGERKQRASTLAESLRHLIRTNARRLPGVFKSAALRDNERSAPQSHPSGLTAGPFESQPHTINALKDVSFELKKGDVLGIIGKNGAGKSTLLKILSRITEPSDGTVRLGGRVGSLLEVGTGFHPELTGRENIYLNATILGMPRPEISRHFDAIVEFAEIGDFIDTPVKRYSSGMYVRLAFAVAAHVRPEILILDEVLSVGDIHFQKKCLGSVEQVVQDGRTVLLVSHSISTVKALCTKAMLLEKGSVAAFGAPDAVIDRYLKNNSVDSALRKISPLEHTHGNGAIRVEEIELLDAATDRFAVYWKQPIHIAVRFHVAKALKQVAFGAGIRCLDGTHVFSVQHDDNQHGLWDFKPGYYDLEFTLANNLRPGAYKLHVGSDHEHDTRRCLLALDAVTLEVLDHSAHDEIPYLSNTGIVNGDSTWQEPKLVSLS